MDLTRRRRNFASRIRPGNRWWIGLLALVAVNAVLIYAVFLGTRSALTEMGFWPGGRASQAATGEAPERNVLTGLVTSQGSREVTAPFSGHVATVAVERGDRVEKGQKLIVMDTARPQEAVQAARAAGDVEAQRQAREQMNTAQRNSPFDGVVTSVLVTDGYWVSVGQPMLRVDQPSKYQVLAIVDPAQAEWLKPGMEATVQWEDGETSAVVHRMEEGEGRYLFRHLIWFQPASVEGLEPGALVRVVLPDGWDRPEVE
jgi:multidrug efflux pump subunit AcrA (membrane-fusion protein)